MKHRYLAFFPAALILLFPMTAYANSSWSWLTDTTPAIVLPFAIVITLAVETFAVIKFGGVKKRLTAASVITLANLASFLVPLLLEIGELPDPSIGEAIKSGLYYAVTAGYLFLTIIIELPVVYFLLHNDTNSKRRLGVSIIVSNVVTTLLVAVTERLLCVPALY